MKTHGLKDLYILSITSNGNARISCAVSTETYYDLMALKGTGSLSAMMRKCIEIGLKQLKNKAK